MFGPQKGADPAAVERLTARLHALAETWPRDPRGQPMTGAAGGLSGGLWAALGARLEPGAPFVLDALGFDPRMREAGAVIVGEGRMDATTLEGKIAGEIAVRARQAGVPVPRRLRPERPRPRSTSASSTSSGSSKRRRSASWNRPESSSPPTSDPQNPNQGVRPLDSEGGRPSAVGGGLRRSFRPSRRPSVECSITPLEVAETAVARPVATPTWDAPGPAVLKKTRSPARISSRSTALPTPNCAWLVRGRRDAGARSA